MPFCSGDIKQVKYILTLSFLLAIFYACREDSDHPWIYHTGVDVSPNGRYLAFGSGDGRIWIINLWDETPEARIIDTIYGVMSLRFSGDAQYLMAASADSLVHVWETENWQKLSEIFQLPFRIGKALENFPSTSDWVCGNGHRDWPMLMFFRFEPDSFPHFQAIKQLPMDGFFEYCLSLNATPDKQKLVVEGYMGDLLYYLNTDPPLQTFKTIYTQEDHGMKGLSLSPNSQYLAFSPLDVPSIFIYDFQKDTIIQVLKLDDINALSFSSDGKFLFVVFNNNILAYWTTHDWSLFTTVQIPDFNIIYIMRAVPYSKRLVLMNHTQVVLWDYNQKRVIGFFNLGGNDHGV